MHVCEALATCKPYVESNQGLEWVVTYSTATTTTTTHDAVMTWHLGVYPFPLH
jgi:hypothetical protein